MSRRRRRKSRQILGAVCAVAALEARRLLSSTLDADGLLTVDGTNTNDSITLGLSGGNVVVTLNSQADGSFPLDGVSAIQVNGLGGDDSISLAGLSVGATLSGGSGNDTLVGGGGADLLAGNDGDDTFFANDANADVISGGLGFDTVSTFDNNDTFNGIEAGIPVAKATVTLGGANGSVILNNAASPIDFGSANQGVAGPTITFTVKNDGTDVLTLGSLNVPTGYTVVDPLSGPLNPGESDSFTLQVDTTAAGIKAGTVSFANSDPNQNPFSFAVTATVNVVAPRTPEVTVTVGGNDVADGQPTAIDFGTVNQFAAGPTLTFTVRNDGNSVLNLSGLTLPAGYTLVNGLAASLDPGDSDTFVVRLDTDAAGTKPGQISFATNDPDEDPFSFPITGVVQANGTAPAMTVTQVAPAGLIDSGVSVVEFGNRNLGGKFASRSFVIKNTGTADLITGDIALPPGYLIIDPLKQTLAPGESDTLTIRFLTSGTTGIKQGQLTIPTNRPLGDFHFGVHGKLLGVGSTPQAEVTVDGLRKGHLTPINSGGALAFGSAAKGTNPSKIARTIRIVNDGVVNLNLGKVTVSAGFVLLDKPTSALKPGASDTLIVALDTKVAVGKKAGTLTITTNDADEATFKINLSGEVTAVGAGGTPEVTVTLGNGQAVADGATSAISFGTVQQGAGPVDRAFKVRNDGSGNLSVGALGVPAGFTVITPLSGPIAPGQTKTFVVRMTTASPGNKTGQISFTTNDANESTFNFAIAGTVSAVVGGGPQVTATLSNGVLTVDGTATIDTISFGKSGKAVTVTGNGKAVGGSPFSGVTKIVVNADDGDDRVDASAMSVPLTLNGGNGNDTLIGGSAGDSLTGGAGNDDLDGRAGNDTLRGGANNDNVTGGAGLDSLFGDDGNDTLNAADGLADLLVDGGTGTNVLHKDRTDV